MMESHGSFGSKIQTLVRHLLYLQVSDPGCKTIVFSAWADSLNSTLNVHIWVATSWTNFSYLLSYLLCPPAER